MLTLALLLSLAGCGTDDFEPEPDQSVPPTTDRVQVADARFDGRFIVSSVTADDQNVALISTPAVEIETRFGGLTVEPGCNTYFGSFTLDEDGDASFTIAGGSSNACGELDDQEQAVLDAFRAATGWVESGAGFRFEGPDSAITISR